MAKLGPLPPIANYMKVRYLWNVAGVLAVNVFNVKFSGTIADTTASQAILSQLATLTTTNIKPLVTTAATLNTIELTDLTTRTSLVDTTPGFGAGSGGSLQLMANNVAMCVSLPVAYRYRGGHPRMYLPAQTALNLTSPTLWTGTWINTVQNGMRAWRTAINSMTGANAPFVLSMISYYTHDVNHQPIYHPGGPQPYAITTATVHARPDSQRRRLGKE